jgi:aminoglycoside phosphotransferase (APT) family kinase protein
MTTSSASKASAFDFDPSRLAKFLHQQMPGLKGTLRLQKIGGGQSNPTYFVDFDNRSMVLRKKPAGRLLPSAHAIDREYRVMQALRGTNAPVPPVVLYHEAEDVLGTAFYLMERVSGRVFNDASLPGMASEERRAIYLAMAEAMAALHAVDWEKAGLTGYGRVGGYIERQLRRWRQQWDLSKTEENPHVDQVFAWLESNLPADTITTIAHGDFKLNNLMFHPTEAKVVAILDWELGTLGNPLADVAFNTIAWRTLPSEYGGIRGLDWSALGIPDETEYLRQYYERASHQQRAEPFHWVFALMRLAVIFEGIAARALSGNATSDNAAEVGPLSKAFASRALEAIDTPAPI